MFNLNQLVEVKLKNAEDFLKVRETLSRIGLASKKDNTLYQSCHILHKQGKYYIVHFKELFLLDGKESSLSEGDIARRNRIILLLDEWELIEVVDYSKVDEPVSPINQIKIIPFKEKDKWNLVTKYTIGSKY
jgi:Bacteriophage translational regulator